MNKPAPPANRVASIRQRLLDRARANGEDFHRVLDRFAVDLILRDVLVVKTRDEEIQFDVWAHRDNSIYLQETLKSRVNGSIQTSYLDRDRREDVADPKYMEPGKIFDLMAYTVIQHHLSVGQASIEHGAH